ncbi:MAG TPA: M23 family metallopeptidase [Burkholderiaceae bacterium]|nr:M23 family metallopeptidase [Burkholderiaceae bacterium]
MLASLRFRQVALLVALVGGLGAVTAFGVAPIADSAAPAPVTITESIPMSLKGSEGADSFLQSELIRRGDTLSSVLVRLGANDPDFLRFVATDATARGALTLRPGRSVRAELDSLGRVLKFAYRGTGLEDDATTAEASTRLVIRRSNDQLVASQEVSPIERSTEMRQVEVRSSLFAATDAAGVPESVAVQISEIFGGDIDLQRGVRRGDRLRVVYEVLRETDSFDSAVATRVLAAELIVKGKSHQAIWFERKGRGEYYGFDGKSLKKAYLLNPLEFSRVTSGFTEERMHPILRDWRAHKGVDFAAPVGTRVRSAADGVVEFVGQQRGYGNVVILKHAKEQTTLYAHLQDFADGLKVGAKVDQGEPIGTVGMTGWSTGPHLHYELRVAGEHVDPMSVAVMPDVRTLDATDRATFSGAIAGYRHRFALLNTIRTAAFQ